MADDKLTPEKCQLYIDEAGEVKATCEDRESSMKLAEILETKPIVITVKPATPSMQFSAKELRVQEEEPV